MKRVIRGIKASNFKTKVSREKRMKGRKLFSPTDLNKEFDRELSNLGWGDSRYQYYITLDRDLMEKSLAMSASEQKNFLIKNGNASPIFSYNQTDI